MEKQNKACQKTFRLEDFNLQFQTEFTLEWAM